MKSILAILAVVCALPPPARAERLYAVHPIDGYGCMRLNVSEAQMLDRHGSGVFILAEPKADAPHGTLAPSVVFVRKPMQVVNGYAAVLQLNGQPGWIAVDKIKPFDGMDRCMPSIMSNGRPGIG